MLYPDQDLNEYLRSLKKLRAMSRDFDTVFSCHGEVNTDPEIIDDILACGKGILSGMLPVETRDIQGCQAFIYRYGRAAMYYPINNT